MKQKTNYIYDVGILIFQLYWSRKQYVNMYNSKSIRMNKGPKGIARTGKVSHARRNPA